MTLRDLYLKHPGMFGINHLGETMCGDSVVTYQSVVYHDFVVLTGEHGIRCLDVETVELILHRILNNGYTNVDLLIQNLIHTSEKGGCWCIP